MCYTANGEHCCLYVHNVSFGCRKFPILFGLAVVIMLDPPWDAFG